MRGAARSGFTLVEVLVALALVGMASALVAGSVGAALDARRRLADSAEAEQRVRVTREFLRDLVRSLAAEREGRGELLVLDAAEGADRLLLSTRGGAPLGYGPEVKAVELRLGERGGESGLVAHVLRPVPGGAVEDTVPLLPGATRFEVRLLDGRGEWHDSWPDGTLAPSAVEMRWEAGPDAGRLAPLPLHVRVP